MKLTIIGLALLACTAVSAASAASDVWRCGASYSASPCPQGQRIAADDGRSAEQREQTRDAAARDKALARELAAERREREAAWRAQGSGLMGIKPLAAADPRPARSDKKKPKRESSRPAARGTSPSAARASRPTRG